MRILIISHAFTQKAAQTRWRRLAALFPHIQVRLLAPDRWVTREFGKEIVFEATDESQGNFEISTVKTTSDRNYSYYWIRRLGQEFREYSPDVIFPTHESFQLIQSILCRWLFAPKARLIFFTMNVHPRLSSPESLSPMRIIGFLKRKFFWWLIRHGTDGAVCHYPDIKEQICREGYQKPVLIQTQIGVNEELFYPDSEERDSIRKEPNLNGFVVGFVGRLVEHKGILDIASAISKLPNDIHLLVVGDGQVRNELERRAILEGWQERLHLTGYVSLNEVAHYMRAMDCLALGSRTIPGWVDTFPLVVAQAMASGLPVIASENGAIPYQLGGFGLLFEEGNVEMLRNHILQLRNDKNLGIVMGKSLNERALKEFCINGLNSKLLDFLLSNIVEQGVKI